MTEMQKFGDPDRFEISARWLEDREPIERLPRAYGWSMGQLCIKVGGVTLTEHHIHGQPQDAIQWYLGPVVAWMLSQWKWLMHEEAYTWSTRSGDSAAFTVEADLERYMGSEFPNDRSIYQQVNAWWMRHALRSADPSALYPHVFIRRVDDNVEISWLDKQPEFAPNDFSLNLKPGAALFLVEEVAKPLWDFLQWAIASAPAVTSGDQAQVTALRTQLDRVQQSQPRELESAHLADDALRVIIEKVRQKHWVPDRKTLADVPVVTQFDMPVLMFGGLNVNIGERDVGELFDILTHQRAGAEYEQLSALVAPTSLHDYLQPYAHGYELAYQVREALGIDPYTAFIDIEQRLERLGIAIIDTQLMTNSIRGVAIAGNDLAPAIVVNSSHKFNGSARGRRFTIAHEFCHILFDRSRAKRLSHISGPWASARVEKRANAFGAMFLATPHALEKALSARPSQSTLNIKQLATKFEMGTAALLEHLHNLDLISEDEFQSSRGYKYN